jgi:hypothetical protein
MVFMVAWPLRDAAGENCGMSCRNSQIFCGALPVAILESEISLRNWWQTRFREKQLQDRQWPGPEFRCLFTGSFRIPA